jgi:predicted alpha/beta superfamily hydrolase
MKVILFWILMVANCLVQAQIPKVSKGSIIYFNYNNSSYIKSREIAIWLPENYSSTSRYNVIYMHDAQSLFDTAVSWNHDTWEVDETFQRLIDEKKIMNCIVVGIYNASWKRRSEYFPQKALTYLPKAMQDSMMQLKDKNKQAIFLGELNADQYLKFIVNELKPYVDSSFSTYKDAAHTYIAGSSMGALISLYALCEYPTVFGGAACLSTHWTGAGPFVIPEITDAILLYFSKNLPSDQVPKLYFDYGSVGLDSLYKPYQNKMNALLLAKNYDEKQWIIKEFVGAAHDEKAWRTRLNVPIEFLLKP